MAIIISFEDQSGQPVDSRNLPPGILHITGYVTGAIGVGEPWLGVTLDMTSEDFMPIHIETRTDWRGRFTMQANIPNVNATAMMRFIAQFPFGAQTETIPVSIGSVSPEPLPEPPQTLDDTINKILIVAAIGFGVYAAAKILPLIIKSSPPANRARSEARV